MSKATVTRLAESPEGEILTAACANPRCDELIERHTGRGRPRDYHDDACRRAMAEDKRRLESRLEHFKEQVAILSERYAPYETLTGDGEASASTDSSQLRAEQVRIAREAVSKVEGALRFLRKHDDEFAADLVELYDAVSPVVRSHI